MTDRGTKLSADPLVVAAGDLAYRRDSCALVIARREDEAVRVLELVELHPKRGAPLTPSGVAEAFADVMWRHRVYTITLDQFGIDGAIESFAKEEIAVIEGPAGQDAKVRSYHALRELMAAKRLKLPLSAVRLRAQLKSIISKPTSGGGLSISAPRRGNGHGDAVSALVLAVHAAANISTVPASAWAEPIASSRWSDHYERGY